jgi:hypothetical protein
MSGPIVRTGSTEQFAAGWDRIFGKKKATASDSAKSSGKSTTKASPKKKAAKKKAAKKKSGK